MLYGLVVVLSVAIDVSFYLCRFYEDNFYSEYFSSACGKFCLSFRLLHRLFNVVVLLLHVNRTACMQLTQLSLSWKCQKY